MSRSMDALTIYRRAAPARMLGVRISARPVSSPAARARVRVLSRASPLLSPGRTPSYWRSVCERESDGGEAGAEAEARRRRQPAAAAEEQGAADGEGSSIAWPHESDGIGDATFILFYLF